MNFSEQLNGYLTIIGCSAKELSDASGISSAALSRYRSGERVPNSNQLEKLVNGIVALAEQKVIPDLNAETVRASFAKVILNLDFDYEQFTANLNTLVTAFNINTSELARHMHFDPSYLSRVRLGQRRPVDLEAFIDGIVDFIFTRYPADKVQASICELVCECGVEGTDDCRDVLTTWLSTRYEPCETTEKPEE